jgi:hypothetical protein
METTTPPQRSPSDTWQDDEEMPFANEESPSSTSQALQTMPDLGFNESCMLFNGDTIDLDGCFTTQDGIPGDFADPYQVPQQHREGLSTMGPGCSTSMWSSMLLSPWLSSPESTAAQSITPITQASTDERLNNTIITIERLSPAAREAVIELVLKDGGSLRIATRTTTES